MCEKTRKAVIKDDETTTALLGHVARKPPYSTENEVQFGTVEGKRARGLPKTQRIDNFMSTAKTTDLHLLIQTAQDQSVWRKLCHKCPNME